MIRAIAVDDEPFALQVLKKMAETIPSLQLVAFFSNAIEARKYLAANNVELLFLDIQMPDMSGIDLLATLDNPPVVIFTTAHSEYAVKSYELSAVDYLLKPFSLQRFTIAYEKATQRLAETFCDDSIMIKAAGEQQHIRPGNILYLESRGNYVQLFLTDRSLMIRATIDDILNLLPSGEFLKVHRSYIVSRQKISRVTRKGVWIGDREIPLSERYQVLFFGGGNGT